MILYYRSYIGKGKGKGLRYAIQIRTMVCCNIGLFKVMCVYIDVDNKCSSGAADNGWSLFAAEIHSEAVSLSFVSHLNGSCTSLSILCGSGLLNQLSNILARIPWDTRGTSTQVLGHPANRCARSTFGGSWRQTTWYRTRQVWHAHTIHDAPTRDLLIHVSI